MIRKIQLSFIISLCIFIIFPSASAESQIIYKIIDKNVFVDISIEKAPNIELEIPYDAKLIDTNAVNYSINDFGNYKTIIITGENISLSYITQAPLEKSRNKYFFILKNPLPQISTDIKLMLPESAVLISQEPSIIPEPESINTDGRSIIITWNNFNEDALLVVYEFIQPSSAFLLMIISVIGIIGIVAGIILILRIKRNLQARKKHIKRSKDKKRSAEQFLTANLFREEKQIIEFLLQHRKHECWTKDIQKALNIPKVRLSRKLRTLEEKGLIQKIPYGNENRILLKKR